MLGRQYPTLSVSLPLRPLVTSLLEDTEKKFGEKKCWDSNSSLPIGRRDAHPNATVACWIKNRSKLLYSLRVPLKSIESSEIKYCRVSPLPIILPFYHRFLPVVRGHSHDSVPFLAYVSSSSSCRFRARSGCAKFRATLRRLLLPSAPAAKCICVYVLRELDWISRPR